MNTQTITEPTFAMNIPRATLTKTKSGLFAIDRQSAARARLLFSVGFDTLEIAQMMGVAEAPVYNGLYEMSLENEQN